MENFYRLTPQDIEDINNDPKLPSDQGVFNEPYGIPDKVKGHVIYCRYETGGVSGGSCWDSTNPQPYSKETPNDRMRVLDLVLAKVKPNISFLEYRMIEGLINNNYESNWEYYGNHTDYKIEYLELSELYDALSKF